MDRPGARWRLGAGAAILVTVVAAPWPRSPEVRGSLPAAGLQRVALLESQGEFARARRLLAADSALAGSAELALLRLRLDSRAGDTASALRELDRHPDSFSPGEAALVRAALRLRRGEAESCLGALAAAVPPAGLENWAALLGAEAACVLGRWDSAGAAAARIDSQELSTEMRHRWLVVRGFVALHRDDVAAMRELAPDLGDAARRDDRTGLLLRDLARAALRDGDVERGRGWLVELLAARPTPAESAYAELGRCGDTAFLTSDAVALALAQFEIRSGRHAAARARLHAALRTAAVGSSQRGELLVALAESQLRTGEYAACLETLASAERSTQRTPLEPERLRMRARAERRSGRNRAAMATYRALAHRFPSHPTADDALYEVGWLYEDRSAFADAERAYLRCARTFPSGALADDSMLRAGLCAWRDGRAAEAAAHFAQLEQRQPHSTLLDNALYWHMLSQVGLGDAAGALGLRDRLERDFPRSYFTVLARRRVEAGLASPRAGEPESSMTRAVLGIAGEAGLGRAARVQAAGDSALATLRRAGFPLPHDFGAETRLWRFLLDHGFGTEALWEARRLERLYDREPRALVEMIAIASQRGANERLVRWAYLLGLRVTDLAYRDALDVLLYPAPYAPSLEEAAARFGLSPAAVIGLMRQESAFDPCIDSGAGARGLMQLMPEVGGRLWEEPGTYHPDLLYQPEVNIELGCRLLAAELGRAGGDLTQALAAYNAGGDAAARWTRRLAAGDPPEMYVDVVEYAETRNYLKTVLGNIETYRRLYAFP